MKRYAVKSFIPNNAFGREPCCGVKIVCFGLIDIVFKEAL